jgi:DNA-binding CsgD family transcriptional regulator
LTILEQRALPPVAAWPVALSVRETTLRLALSFVIEDAGWSRAEAPGPRCLHVADRVSGGSDERPLDVLVVAPTPATSRAAMAAFSEGRTRAVLDATRPDELPRTLELVAQLLCVVPVEILDAAHHAPALSRRLDDTLHLLLRGQPNRLIARSVQQSEATTKRDVAELLRLFDAPNRTALVATATRLGYTDAAWVRHEWGSPSPPDRP